MRKKTGPLSQLMGASKAIRWVSSVAVLIAINHSVFAQRPKVETRDVGVAFLLDVSGSMGPEGGKKWGNALSAVKTGLAKVRESALANRDRKLESVLLLFDDRFYSTEIPLMTVDAKFPTDPQIRFSRYGGGTHIGSAIEDTSILIQRQSKVRHWHILVITDGQNSGGTDPARILRILANRRADATRGDRQTIEVSMIAYEMEHGAFKEWEQYLFMLQDANANGIGRVLDNVVKAALAEDAAEEGLYDACEVKERLIASGRKLQAPTPSSVSRVAEKNSVLDWFVDRSALEKIGEKRAIDYETIIYQKCQNLSGAGLRDCLRRECVKIVYLSPK